MPDEDDGKQIGTGGKDSLSGTDALDDITGGPEKDTFVFRTDSFAPDLDGTTLDDGDRIRDYESEEEIILEGTHQAVDAELEYDETKDETRLELDLNGDGIPDRTIIFDGDKRGELTLEPNCCGVPTTVITIKLPPDPPPVEISAVPGVYLALFGRPADPLGLTFFNEATRNGADLTAIGDLASTAEYQDRFTGFTPPAIVAEIYQSLFNRGPDLPGLQFFVEALQSGRQTINSIAINILEGARGEDRTIIGNKLAASIAFTTALDTTEEITAYQGGMAAAAGRALLSGITADPATIPDADAIAGAIADIIGEANPNPVGETFLLTAGIDNLTGTAGDDTFLADADGGVQTLNSGDTITGGGGNDTLEAELPDGGEIDPALLDFANAFFKFTGGGTFNAINANFDGTLWSDASTTGANFTNVTPQLSIGVRGTGATSLSTVTATFISDRGKFRLDNANGETLVTPSPLEILDITYSGKNSIALDADQTKKLFLVGEDLHLTIRSADLLEKMNVSPGESFELSPFLVKEDEFAFTGGYETDHKVVLVATAPDQKFVVVTFTGDDEIRTGSSRDFISVGSGADFVVPRSGADIIRLGTDSDPDRIMFRPGDSDDSAENLTVVFDFASGVDKVDIGSFGAMPMSEITRTHMQGDIAGLGSDATLRQALDIAEEYALQDRLTHFIFKGDTYVYIDQTNPNTGYAEGDFVAKLVGAITLVDADFEF